MARSPLETRTLRAALGATGLIGAAACLAGGVRLLPWLLDPGVTFRLALPFARSLFALAAEAAILLGWPIGWALAAAHVVERGEARALAALGESPARSLSRLAVQGSGFACALAFVSFLGGREATEPGRVVTDLVERGRLACLAAAEETTFSVPFAGVTWLCAPGLTPRLSGRWPGAATRAPFTAREATVSGDLREITLTDAHVALGTARVRAGVLRLRGLAPFARASSVPPALRAAALALAGAAGAACSVLGILLGAVRGRMRAILLSASSGLTGLGLMRSFDLAPGSRLGAISVPFVTLLATILAAAILSRLPGRMRAASKEVHHG